MRILFVIYPILGLLMVSCFQANQQPIEPKNVEPISEKTVLTTPKDSLIITVKIDSIILKIDSLKPVPPTKVIEIPKVIETPKVVVVKQDSIKKVPGEQIFEFYETTSPDISFHFPSHSVVMIPVNKIGIDIGVGNSFCEYWLYTKAGKLVCHCKNTVSGLHPVYGNSFNANNHLPEYNKKIAFGEYRLVYKNISKVPVRQDLIFGLVINNGKDQIDVKVDSGETKEFWINIFPSTSNFKLNNNNKVSL